MRITDRSVLHLIRMWLESPVSERDEDRPHDDDSTHAGHAARRSDLALVGEHLPALVREGVPRPDGPATWAKAKIVRYADDFVILARYVRTATDAVDRIDSSKAASG